MQIVSAEPHQKRKSKLGEEAMVALYGGVSYEGLDLLRLRKFTTKVMSSSTFVEMHTLPPTADSAMFHIYRTFYQVKEWMAEGEFEFTDWGWAVQKGRMCSSKK